MSETRPGRGRPGTPDEPERAGASQLPANLESVSPLDPEEYIEQAHLFTVMGQRLRENMPAQEILDSIREEILATTKLPMAVDFMLAELRHLGAFSTAMMRLFLPYLMF